GSDIHSLTVEEAVALMFERDNQPFAPEPDVMIDEGPVSNLLIPDPVIVLDRWAVLRIGDAGLLLAGSEAGEYPRVSTPIVSLDLVNMTATTASGQRYLLVGGQEPGYALSAVARFNRYECADIDVVDVRVAVAELQLSRNSEFGSGNVFADL